MRSMDSTGEKHIILCITFQYQAAHCQWGNGPIQGVVCSLLPNSVDRSIAMYFILGSSIRLRFTYFQISNWHSNTEELCKPTSLIWGYTGSFGNGQHRVIFSASALYITAHCHSTAGMLPLCQEFFAMWPSPISKKINN